MEEEENIPQEKKKSRKTLYIILFIILIGACAVLAWLLWSQKNETQTVVDNNIQITAESEVVKRDLQQLQTQYATLVTNDSSLKSEIDAKKELIEQLEQEAEKHKNDAYIMSKLKKETKTLRAIMQHFVIQIDSLNTLNKILIAKNDSVTTELHTEQEKSLNLKDEKEKLYQIGSIIKATGMAVTAIHVKSKNKVSETTRSKRTDIIRIIFKLEENDIAPKGPRTLYARIVMPDGKEWTESTDADHLFAFGNSKGYYAMKKSIPYNQEDINIEMLIKKRDKQELQQGKYIVEVYMGKAFLGKETLQLD